MENTFSLKILAADEALFEGDAASLIFSAPDGEMQILSHHEDMIVANKQGSITVKTEDGIQRKAEIGNGFVKIVSNSVIMIVDFANWTENGI